MVLICSTLEDEHEAIRRGEEALELALELQVPSYVAWAPMMLATRLVLIDPLRAEALLDQAIEAAERIDHPWVIFMASQSLAMVQAVQGLYEAAARTILGGAERSHEYGDDGAAWNSAGLLACLLAASGSVDAALLTGAWAQLHGYKPDRHTAINPTYQAFRVDGYLDLRDRQAPEENDRLAHRARSMDTAEILAFVRRNLDGD